VLYQTNDSPALRTSPGRFAHPEAGIYPCRVAQLRFGRLLDTTEPA